ncbi:hypothetical protein QPB17_000216 [Vibrio cholerae]|nr:hypothetical protein [Vibrio cholerae]ELT8458709.1 hypothetical protein [Vibrio cholerae]
MKTLSLEQVNQLLNTIKVINIGCHQLQKSLMNLPKDDPARISAEAIIEGAEDFQGVEMQINEASYQQAVKLFDDLEKLQGPFNQRVHAFQA